MTEPHIAYEPWRSLDPGRRYCLIDTMDLLQVYRSDRRLASMVETVRDGRTMLLVPGVVDECFSVFQRHKPDTASAEPIYVGDESGYIYELFDAPIAREDFDVEPRSRGEFDRLLAECLRRWGIEFAAARPDPGALAAAMAIHAEKRYRGRGGVPLSRVDCILLRLAIENRNVDVITDDATLARAVLTECGPERASLALSYYFGRLNMTADFLTRILGVGLIYCNPIRDHIEYHIRDARSKLTPRPHPDPDSEARKDRSLLCSIQVSSDDMGVSYGPARRNLALDDTRAATFALLDFVGMVVADWYCACGDEGWTKFDKKWTDVEYDYDTMQVKSRANRPYYDIAKSVLEKNRGRYCACSKPNERRLHEGFRDIMAEVD